MLISGRVAAPGARPVLLTEVKASAVSLRDIFTAGVLCAYRCSQSANMSANLQSTGSASSAEAQTGSVPDLISRIKSADDAVRTLAWQEAATVGAPAVKPLAALITDSDLEVARAAKRGLWKIVHHAGRPDAEAERKAVSKELLGLLDGQLAPMRHEVFWMLSEIGGADAVRTIAGFLANPDSREDARAVLERIPGKESVAALEAALASSAEEFKPALANSLRVRGVKVQGYPSQKLVPTRPAPASSSKSS
jgi:hypothetical protein